MHSNTQTQPRNQGLDMSSSQSGSHARGSGAQASQSGNQSGQGHSSQGSSSQGSSNQGSSNQGFSSQGRGNDYGTAGIQGRDSQSRNSYLDDDSEESGER